MTIRLSSDEREALQSLADSELRPLREQIRHVLREKLERRCLLPNSGINELSEKVNAEGQPPKVDLLVSQKGINTRGYSAFAAALNILRLRGRLIREQNGRNPATHEGDILTLENQRKKHHEIQIK